MKIIAISDWRVQPLEDILYILDREKPDMLIYCGDDLNRIFPMATSISIDKIVDENTEEYPIFYRLWIEIINLIKKEKQNVSLLLKRLSDLELVEPAIRTIAFLLRKNKITYLNGKLSEITKLLKKAAASKLNESEKRKWNKLKKELSSRILPKASYITQNIAEIVIIATNSESVTKFFRDFKISPGFSLLFIQRLEKLYRILKDFENFTIKNGIDIIPKILSRLKFQKEDTTIEVYIDNGDKKIPILSKFPRVFELNVVGKDGSVFGIDITYRGSFITDILEHRSTEQQHTDIKIQEQKLTEHPIEINITHKDFNDRYCPTFYIGKTLVNDKITEDLLSNNRRIYIKEGYWSIEINPYPPFDLVKECEKRDISLLYVMGNDEDPYNYYPDNIQSNGKFFVYNVEKHTIKTDDGWSIIGIGGGLKIGLYTKTEKEIKEELERKLREIEDNHPIILVTHPPPKGILDLSIRFSEKPEDYHIGSLAIREVLEKHPNIKLVLCGHSHLCGGKIYYLKKGTYIVNVANHDNFDRMKPGFYCIFEIGKNGRITAPMIFKSSIDWTKIRGIGKIRRTYLDPHLLEAERIVYDLLPQNVKKKLALYLSYLKKGTLENNSSIIRNIIAISKIPQDAIFMDIETELFSEKNKHGIITPDEDPEKFDLIYIGNDEEQIFIASIALFCRDTGEIKWFFVDNYENTQKMIRAVESYLNNKAGKVKKPQIFAWSAYEERILKKYGFKYKIHDLIPIIEEAIELPNYALKDVEKYLGIDRKNKELDGVIVGAMISHTIKYGYKCPYCKAFFPEGLKRYNIEDVVNIERIIKKIKKIANINL